MMTLVLGFIIFQCPLTTMRHLYNDRLGRCFRFVYIKASIAVLLRFSVNKDFIYNCKP